MGHVHGGRWLASRAWLVASACDGDDGSGDGGVKER